MQSLQLHSFRKGDTNCRGARRSSAPLYMSSPENMICELLGGLQNVDSLLVFDMHLNLSVSLSSWNMLKIRLLCMRVIHHLFPLIKMPAYLQFLPPLLKRGGTISITVTHSVLHPLSFKDEKKKSVFNLTQSARQTVMLGQNGNKGVYWQTLDLPKVCQQVLMFAVFETQSQCK